MKKAMPINVPAGLFHMDTCEMTDQYRSVQPTSLTIPNLLISLYFS